MLRYAVEKVARSFYLAEKITKRHTPRRLYESPIDDREQASTVGSSDRWSRFVFGRFRARSSVAYSISHPTGTALYDYVPGHCISIRVTHDSTDSSGGSTLTAGENLSGDRIFPGDR